MSSDGRSPPGALGNSDGVTTPAASTSAKQQYEHVSMPRNNLQRELSVRLQATRRLVPELDTA